MIKESAIVFEGKVYTGRRHFDVIKIICDELEKLGRPRRCGSSGQGFVTDKGEFLDRLAACQHAVECGQITLPKKIAWSKELFSEDLY